MESYDVPVTTIDKFKLTDEQLDLKDMGKDINVSTVTSSLTFNVIFNLDNIIDHLPLSINGIETVKYREKYRSADLNAPKLAKPKKGNIDTVPRKKRNSFQYHVTAVVRIRTLKILNVKIFKEGVIQITGTQTIDDFNDVLKTIYKTLITRITLKNDNKYISFFSGIKKDFELKLLKKDIYMINGNYDLGFEIDQHELYKVFKNLGLNPKLQNTMHSGMTVKNFMKDNHNQQTLIIFKTGKMIITVKNSWQDIINSRDFIVDCINKHKDTVIKSDILEMFISDYDRNPDIIHTEFEKFKNLKC